MVSEMMVTSDDGNRDCLNNNNLSGVMDTDILQTRLFSADGHFGVLQNNEGHR